MSFSPSALPPSDVDGIRSARRELLSSRLATTRVEAEQAMRLCAAKHVGEAGSAGMLASRRRAHAWTAWGRGGEPACGRTGGSAASTCVAALGVRSHRRCALLLTPAALHLYRRQL